MITQLKEISKDVVVIGAHEAKRENKMNISFDFDNTLQNPAVQLLAQGFIDDGHKVFIITSRLRRRENKDLFEVSKKLGKPLIRFTNGDSKVSAIQQLQIDIHFEDCPVECEQLRPFCTVIQVEPFIIEEE